MSDQKHNERAEVTQHVYDLLNGGIDGELSRAEQLELNTVLANSQQVRDLNEELLSVTGLLDKAPEREPPQYLQAAIERQVRLPSASNSKGKPGNFFNTWLTPVWLRTGVVLAAGVVLTFGVYEMGSGPMSARDAANMTGTVVKHPVSAQGEVLDSFRLDSETLEGYVEIRSSGDVFSLDMQLNSAGPAEIVVDFSDRGLELASVMRGQDEMPFESTLDGFVRLVNNGSQTYSLKLQRTADVPQAKPLGMEFFSGNKLVHEAELSMLE